MKLFDELKKNHLLILGVDLSTDWLTRIFLRTAKGGRLSTTHDFLEILADGKPTLIPGGLLPGSLQQPHESFPSGWAG